MAHEFYSRNSATPPTTKPLSAIMKIALKIFATLSFAFAVITGSELLKPLRYDTASVSQIIALRPNKTITFETNYDYGYIIEIRSENLDHTITDSINFNLDIDGNKEDFINTYNVGNAPIEIGSFTAKEGDNCRLKFTSIGPDLLGQNVRLIIDVNGGGPSVGNVWAKELRPTIRIIFLVSATLFVLMILLLIVVKRNADNSH